MLWPLSRTFVVEKGRLALIGVEFFFQAPMIFVRKVTKDLYYPFGEISNFDMRHVEYLALVGAMGSGAHSRVCGIIYLRDGGMARDKGLEEFLNDSLEGVPGLTQKAMFGGWAWLVNGNLLCGARTGGMLVRLGRENEAWALKIPGIVPMMMRGRQMRGWVRAAPEAYGNDAVRQRLVDAALEFNRSIPKK